MNQFYQYFKNVKIQDISKDDILSYLDSKEENNLKKSTLESIRAILRVFFCWLEEEKVIQINPILKIKPYKQPNHIVKVFTLDQLEDIRESCKTLKERSLVEIFYSTGCRLNEVAQMNISDINWSNKSIKVLGKGNKERIVFFSNRAKIHLKKYLKSRNDNCEALFVTDRKEYRRLSNRGIQRTIKSIGIRIGLDDIHCHQFRRSYLDTV